MDCHLMGFELQHLDVISQLQVSALTNHLKSKSKFIRGVALGVEIEIAESGHLRPLIPEAQHDSTILN